MSTTSSTKTPEKTAPPTSRSTSSDTLKAQGLHVAAGTALTTYAVVHRIAQDDAEALRVRAVTAQTEIDTAQIEFTAANTALRNAEDDQKTAGTPIPDQVTRRFNTAKTTLATRQATLRGIQDELPGIVSTWNTAAATAESAITTVIYNDDVGDGFWDNHGSKIASWVSEWAGRISEYVGYAALLLAWVPVLGPILGAVATAAAAIALVANIALALGGDGSWGTVVWGFAGLASFGVGRYAKRRLSGAAEKAVTQGLNRTRNMRKAPGAGHKGPTAQAARNLDRANRARARSMLSAAKPSLRNSNPKLFKPTTWNTWFNQGARSFKGLHGKQIWMNFSGRGPEAWAAQRLRNAESVTAAFRAGSEGGYTVTLKTIDVWASRVPVATFSLDSISLVNTSISNNTPPAKVPALSLP